ncbi:hypothetical protein BV25DRAFT_1793920 [Artomyces pyxidatus]|uniref:Uncharacterized protein n=1 Tax=Artomyces pyxidatus TaxID=48021 RepID=A0ACB8TH15_9AGAM|nr:hypothetical protein BV25DRAFT_1793920 [Artomyces pyxidatus]
MSSSHSKRIIVTEPLLRTGCLLGEGPLYDAHTSTLHFVDILDKKVFHLNTETLSLDYEQFSEPVTCLALRRNRKGLACATASGIAIIEGRSDLRYITQPIPEEDRPFKRFNDGACDRQGRFFIGSVFSKERNLPGLLHRYDPEDGTCVVVDEGPFTDTNGIGWSADDKTMYFTDSLTNIIYAYDYDNGMISNRRVFVDAIAQGLPEGSFCDGLCLDSEGCIWSARWGGSRINRFDKDGKIDVEVLFPTAYSITACCFGGPNEDQLFVTSAHTSALGGDGSRQAQYPHSGDLFVVDLSGQYRGGKWRHEFAL